MRALAALTLSLGLGCAANTPVTLPPADARVDVSAPDVTAPEDVPDDATVPDVTAPDVAAPDAGSPDAPRDAAPDAPRDAAPPMDAPQAACDRRFAFSPAAPGDDAPFEVAVTDGTGWVHIGLDVVGGGAPRATWLGVTGSGPFTWRWRVEGLAAGSAFFRFTADMRAREIATCVRAIAARGGTRDASVDAAPDVVRDATPASAPPANRFGIGLVAPGSAAQLDLSARLVGAGGHVKLVFAGIRPGMTSAPAEWSNAVRDAYARDLVPVVRIGPAWEDRRVRNQSDDGAGLRYTRLAQAYRDVVRGLPLRAGWPFYVEVHNEPNLCYEWPCDPGSFAGDRISVERIAQEYAAMLRDVSAALRSLGDARVRVVNGGLAPGGVRWCRCVGPRDVRDGEWEGGTTSLDFLRAMSAAVPGVWQGLDAFASHAYPATGRGWGFFAPYASAGTGLRYYRDELAVVGRALPVLVTETGWSTARDGGGTNSRDEIAAWTRQAWQEVWLTDPAVRAVMPFMLQDAAWDRFAWVSPAGAEYPVYTATRALRCAMPGAACR